MSESELNEFIKSLKISYHSGHGDKLYKDFYSPLLLHTKLYIRETGDFTTNVIFDWGEGLANALEKKPGECLIKLIANPKLQENDRNVLLEVLENKNNKDYLNKLTNFVNNVTEKTIERSFEEAKADVHKEIKLKIFSYLIANNILILKFGEPNHVPNANVFHPKSGVFYFSNDTKVGFIGGSNETHGGYVTNIEYIHVYNNLNGENYHIKDIEEKFKIAWEGKAEGFKTISLKKEFLKKIETYAPSLKKLKEDIRKYNQEHKKTLGENISDENKRKLNDLANKLKTSESDLDTKKVNYLDITEKKWEFQKQAREKFIEKKSGILEMATGTGKTRTALSIITQLLKDKKINKIIIQIEKNDLQDQWEENIKEWLKSETYTEVNFLKYTSSTNQLSEFLLNFNDDATDLLLVSKFNLPSLLNKIQKYNLKKTFILHDEVHGLFTDKIKNEIIGKQIDIGYKLGLTATIEDKFNKSRTDTLFDEIGEIIFEYPLEKAIEDGVLVEFDLIPLNYKLLEEDKKKISDIWAIFNSTINEGGNPLKAEKDRNIAIAGVKKNCLDKVRVFENNFNLLEKHLNRSFIFADETKYVKKILNTLIHKKINVKTHIGNDSYENIENFSKGKIDCLLNCEKLSEGIDVKNVNTIVLFATPQGIQLIQRLGRVLRTDKKYPDKKACVVDFFLERDMENGEGSDYNRYKILHNLSKIKKVN
ncbi:helicase/type III restriction enzyme, res subunit [alpha proteobacterium HIMB5]|nr:helicase/type III restriction enzyme, res subunit [alpha proteobacterium HIMB5]